jgi:hypothetical protein
MSLIFLDVNQRASLPFVHSDYKHFIHFSILHDWISFFSLYIALLYESSSPCFPFLGISIQRGQRPAGGPDTTPHTRIESGLHVLQNEFNLLEEK